MKKKNLTTLKLNKEIITDFKTDQIKGGERSFFFQCQNQTGSGCFTGNQTNCQ